MYKQMYIYIYIYIYACMQILLISVISLLCTNMHYTYIAICISLYIYIYIFTNIHIANWPTACCFHWGLVRTRGKNVIRALQTARAGPWQYQFGVCTCVYIHYIQYTNYIQMCITHVYTNYIYIYIYILCTYMNIYMCILCMAYCLPYR